MKIPSSSRFVDFLLPIFLTSYIFEITCPVILSRFGCLFCLKVPPQFCFFVFLYECYKILNKTLYFRHFWGFFVFFENRNLKRCVRDLIASNIKRVNCNTLCSL